MKVVFSHGKESGPWGSKITKLANIAKELGFDVDSIDYTNMANPEERVVKLNSCLDSETQPYVLVGSSMGGYVSLVAAQTNEPVGVFLLAPALFMSGYNQQTYATNLGKVEIVHGWCDDVIPVENSIKYAEQARCSLHLIDGDHRLNSSIEHLTSIFNMFLNSIKPNNVN